MSTSTTTSPLPSAPPASFAALGCALQMDAGLPLVTSAGLPFVTSTHADTSAAPLLFGSAGAMKYVAKPKGGTI
eukprot:CAMPEP_0198220654 /NCGR_PEP_ID=MMETSP1445-20131203/80103_1 /TAXON_ID=36898 /ORGANISM="Pyramimonas sp., Strain CCMP2087" /LENGTH=73 /DNA_ID=CAMNT_0043898513 /DNA_START=278 /DNA_END=496 /DNA_ORIENTATION=+